jgi:NAD-dependent dihydropyrimidine dehydrogenase PreA subunit
MGNITMQDGKPRWDNNCTQCMACIAYCPKQAIEYGKATKGKTRYRCKELE